MNQAEIVQQYSDIINGRLEQLNSIVQVVLANMKQEINDEDALRTIQGILTQENK